MSLVRFLTDTVEIKRSVAQLPSGEAAEPVVVAQHVPCRIRSARESDVMRFSSEAVASGAYRAIFATNAFPVQVNDRLTRDQDRLVFRAVGFPDQQGQPGHAMAHVLVPVVRVGGQQ